MFLLIFPLIISRISRDWKREKNAEALEHIAHFDKQGRERKEK